MDMNKEDLITMNSKQENIVYTEYDHVDLKEEFELKEKQMPTCQEEFNSDEIKSELKANISFRNNISVHSECNCSESSLFIKKELTDAKDIQVTQNLYESQSKFMEADETEIKEEAFEIDTDYEITHFIKKEIVDHENFKDEVFIDEQCNVKFQTSNFLCDLCNENISDKKTLDTHCNGHLKLFENVDVINIASVQKNLKQHSCDICDKSFSQRHHLKQHITAVHKKLKQFSCEICEKCFSRRSHLKQHIASVHNNLKKHSCEICEKSFSERGHLKKHINRVHNNIKQHSCEICAKSFFDRSTLQQHIISVHNKIKLFSCEMCNKPFSTKGNLKQHITIVHNNIKKYLCELCNRSFPSRRNLKQHITIIHNNHREAI